MNEETFDKEVVIDNATSAQGILGLMPPRGRQVQPEGRRPEGWTWRPRGGFKPRIPRAEVALLHNYTAGMIFDSLTMIKPHSVI